MGWIREGGEIDHGSDEATCLTHDRISVFCPGAPDFRYAARSPCKCGQGLEVYCMLIQCSTGVPHVQALFHRAP